MPTGYGTQTKIITDKLAADGHDVCIVATGGLTGTNIISDGIKVAGSGPDARHTDLLPSIAMGHAGQNGVCITLMDVWAYANHAWDGMNVFSWTPLEHIGLSEPTLEWFNKNKHKTPIAMSKFGVQQLKDAGISDDRILYAPHSVDTNTYMPLGPSMRDHLRIPADAHVTIINSSNIDQSQNRKCWPEMIYAWTQFALANKDAYLYLHAEVYGQLRGIRLDKVMESLGTPTNRVRIAPQLEYRQGLPTADMAKLYSMSDVLLMTSKGEGFGIPAIEAQACGIPVILSDFSAQSELLGSGWLVDVQREWDPYYGGWWGIPRVQSIIGALEQSYTASKNSSTRESMKQAAVNFAANYETDIVYKKYWSGIIERIVNEQK